MMDVEPPLDEAHVGERPLAGRSAVVTGASRGIGRAVAERLAAEGADVVVNSSGATAASVSALEDLVSQINGRRGGQAIAHPGPIEDYDFASTLMARCVDAFGRLDALANIAGIPSGATTVLEVSPSEWQRLIDVNLTGTFNCCRHALPIMVEQRDGSIINTSSDAFTGSFMGSGYGAAKGGVNSLSYIIAKQYREERVRCNAICPSALTALHPPAQLEERMRVLHVRGFISDEVFEASKQLTGPEFVASLYAYLASSRATSISGEVFRIDGTQLHRYPTPTLIPLGSRPRDEGPLSLSEVHRFVQG